MGQKITGLGLTSFFPPCFVRLVYFLVNAKLGVRRGFVVCGGWRALLAAIPFASWGLRDELVRGGGTLSSRCLGITEKAMLSGARGGKSRSRMFESPHDTGFTSLTGLTDKPC